MSRHPLALRFVLVQTGGAEVGYSIGRRVGGAVVRNKVKRRLRSSMAQHIADLPDGLYLISTGPEVTSLSYADLDDRVAELSAAVPA